MIWTCRQFRIDLSRTQVMGIVNVTPDSFSDGGCYFRTDAALSHVRKLVREGMDILDLGAESTRPGATPLTWQAEWTRLDPLLRVLAREFPRLPLSIDTYHPETAERALDRGASILNCVYPQFVPSFLDLARASGCGLVLPVAGTQIPHDLRSQIVLDPMVGFGTTREQDLAIFGGLRTLAQKSPVLMGVSRKRIIGMLTGTTDPRDRLGGSVGAALWCAMNGASIVRVHDVKETKQALQVLHGLAEFQKGGKSWTGSIS